MALVNFFNEDINFKLSHPRKTAKWVKDAILKERRAIKSLNIVFCSDRYLADINFQYLNHTTFTDIVTFNQSENPKVLEGDIFISVERVRENAEKFDDSFDNELHRVIIHGVLHLIGFDDKSKAKKMIMRKKEDAYLSLR